METKTKAPKIDFTVSFNSQAQYKGEPKKGYVPGQYYLVAIQASPFCIGVWLNESTPNYLGYRDFSAFSANWTLPVEQLPFEESNWGQLDRIKNNKVLSQIISSRE